jgi:hypothetical protein
MKNTKRIILVLSLTLVLSCSKEESSKDPEEVSLNILPNSEINKMTSYYNYVSSYLYKDLSLILNPPEPYNDVNTPYYGSKYSSRAFADFDKDGDVDIMAGGHAQNDALNTSARPMKYYQNKGNTFLINQTVFNAQISESIGWGKAIIGDFDNNGFVDVAITRIGLDYAPWLGEEQKITLNTNGNFTTKTMPISGVYSICAGDIDNDGDLDLFYSGIYNNVSKFLINDGTGNFTYDASRFPTKLGYLNYNSPELYDVNKDGYLDLVLVGHEMQDAQSIVLWGSTIGKYSINRMTVLPKINGYGTVLDIDFIDFNSDSKTDILLTRTGDGTSNPFYKGYYLQMLKNDGNSFSDVSSTVIKNNSTQIDVSDRWSWINWIRIHDVDNDGDLDITAEDKYYNLEWENVNGVFSKQP